MLQQIPEFLDKTKITIIDRGIKKENITIHEDLTPFQKSHSKIKHKDAKAVRKTMVIPAYVYQMYYKPVRVDEYRCSICNMLIMTTVWYHDHKDHFVEKVN